MSNAARCLFFRRTSSDSFAKRDSQTIPNGVRSAKPSQRLDGKELKPSQVLRVRHRYHCSIQANGDKPVLCRVCFAKQSEQPQTGISPGNLPALPIRVIQITFSESTLPCNGKMPISSLETILDRELAEKIISQSAEIVPQDGILFRQGEPADCLYFVKSGEASLTMQAGDKEVTIRATQGSLLGIPAIVGNQPYSMTGTACWDAEIFRLSSLVFSDLMKTEPGMQQAVLRILAGEVRVARQALSELSLWP